MTSDKSSALRFGIEGFSELLAALDRARSDQVLAVGVSLAVVVTELPGVEDRVVTGLE